MLTVRRLIQPVFQGFALVKEQAQSSAETRHVSGQPIPEAIQSSRVIAIGRRLEPRSIVQVAAALVGGGVRAFEVTLDSPDAIAGIRALAERYADGSLLVGAGTGSGYRSDNEA